jgi:hypothetical protein
MSDSQHLTGYEVEWEIVAIAGSWDEEGDRPFLTDSLQPVEKALPLDAEKSG